MKKWIQGADLKEGAFTEEAKAHGMSVSEFASVVRDNPAHYSDTTVKRANLANTFRKMAKRKK
jgi:hypothetical protein